MEMAFFYEQPEAREAARKIARILSELEVLTGNIVKSIELRGIEVTQMESKGREMQMHVQIELERSPGHHWAQ